MFILITCTLFALSNFLTHCLPWWPSIKYVTLFLTNFDPLSHVTLCHTSRDPLKYVTHLGPPIFSSTKKPDKNPLYKVSLNGSWGFCLGFCSGLLSGRFCPGWSLSVPPSVGIPPLQQKLKHHFQFHVSNV